MKDNPKFSRFEPRLVLEDDSWYYLSETERKSYFPLTGLVFWPFKEKYDFIMENSLFYFKVDENPDPKSKEDPLRDQWYIPPESTLIPLLPILDFTNYTNEEIRQNLFEQGIDNPTEDATVFVKFSENYAGVVVNLFKSDHDLYKTTDYKMVETHIAEPKEIVSINGIEYIFKNKVKKEGNFKTFNWQNNAEFITSIVNKCKDGFKLNGRTNNDLREIKEILKSIEVYPTLESTQLQERWEHLSDQIEAKSDSMRELSNTLLESSKGQELLLIAVERTRRAKENEIKEEIVSANSELQAIEKKKQTIQNQIDRLKTERDGLKQTSSNLKSEVCKQAEEFRSLLSSVSVLEYPAASLFSDRLDKLINNGLAPDVASFPSATPPWGQSRKLHQLASKISVNDLPERFKSEEDLGLSPDYLQLLDAFARSGEFVLLLGDGAEQYVKRYSACIGEDNLYLMQPDPSTISLDDLWRVPGNQLPTGLARAWQAALENPYRLYLVWLHSINVAPWQLWFEAFFNVLQSPIRPKNLLTVGTLSATPPPIQDYAKFRKALLSWLVPLKIKLGSMKPTKISSTFLLFDSPIKEQEFVMSANSPYSLIEFSISQSFTFPAYQRHLKLGAVNPEMLLSSGSWPSENWQETKTIHAALRDGAALLTA
jgi:hypothetical protein